MRVGQRRGHRRAPCPFADQGREGGRGSSDYRLPITIERELNAEIEIELEVNAEIEYLKNKICFDKQTE